jgi:hypothetical protein
VKAKSDCKDSKTLHGQESAKKQRLNVMSQAKSDRRSYDSLPSKGFREFFAYCFDKKGFGSQDNIQD